MEKKEYMNIQTGEKLDWSKVQSLPDNTMLKVKPELWVEWDFEKNDEIGLDIWKMTKGSSAKVWWNCKKCNSVYESSPYYKNIGRNCPYCVGKKVNETNSLASLNPKLASEWHPTKNGDLTPHDVSVGSSKKIWWKCNKGHEWEAFVYSRVYKQGCPYCSNRKVDNKNSLASLNPKLASEWHSLKNGKLTPSDVACGSNKKVWWLGKCGHEWRTTIVNRSSGTNCPYCSNNKILKGFNDMWTTNPELAKLLVNPEDGYKYTQWSNTKINWQCNNCELIINGKSPNSVNKKGLCCSYCSDKISYSEKVISYILKKCNVNYIHNKTLNWSNGKRYDFYIPSLSCIIECHGIQHYEESPRSNRTLKQERENDYYKRDLASQNGIKHYIELDCRESNFNYILNNIKKSTIHKLLNLNNYILKECEIPNKNIMLEAWKMFNEGFSVSEISEALNLSKSTIVSYLKKGNIVGKCKYDSKGFYESKRKKIIRIDSELNIKEYNSARDASYEENLTEDRIRIACRKKTIYNDYFWLYIEDYNAMNDDDKYYLFNFPPVIGKSQPVVVLNRLGNLINSYPSLSKTSNALGIPNWKLWKIINNKTNNNTEFIFMYLDKYREVKTNE